MSSHRVFRSRYGTLSAVTPGLCDLDRDLAAYKTRYESKESSE